MQEHNSLKLSNLLWKVITYGRKKFYNIDHWSNFEFYQTLGGFLAIIASLFRSHGKQNSLKQS